MRKLFGALALMLAAGVAFAATSASISWTGPTLNTDGSAITGAVTYNLYTGAQGVAPEVTSVQKGITTPSATVTTGLTAGATVCFAVSAVVGGVEGAQTAPSCVAVPLPTPGVPTQVTIVLH